MIVNDSMLARAVLVQVMTDGSISRRRMSSSGRCWTAGA